MKQKKQNNKYRLENLRPKRVENGASARPLNLSSTACDLDL